MSFIKYYDSPKTVAEARADKFPWDVAERALFHSSLDETHPVQDREHKAILRADTGARIGTVGVNYGVISPATFEDNARTVFGDGAVIDAAGTMGAGSKIWMLGRTGDDYTIGKDPNPNRSQLLYVNSFDGSMGNTMLTIEFSFRCFNQYSSAIAGAKSMMVVRHTAHGRVRSEDAARAMAMATKHQETYQAWANHLASEAWTAREMTDLAEHLVPTKDEDNVPTVTANKRDTIVGLFDGGRGHEHIRGSAWAAINAVTEYVDHHAAYRGSGEKRRDNALASQWFGPGSKLKSKAAMYVTQHCLERVPAGPAGYVSA